MNKLLVVSLIALSFATGFTCSKKAPEQAAVPAGETMSGQAEMAAPVSGNATATPAPAETK